MVLPLLAFAAVACSTSDSTLSSSDVTDLTASAYRTAGVASISVSPAQTTIAVGANLKLGTSLYDSQGNLITGVGGIFTRWISTDTTVATVSASGVVHGIRNGVVTVRAVAGIASGSSLVTVGSGATTTSGTPTSTTTATSPTPSGGTTSPSTNFQGAIVYDDFTRYATTSDFLGAVSSNIGGSASPSVALYTDGGNVTLAAIDPTIQYKQHATLRYDQPAGSSATPELFVYFPNGQTVTHLWFRTKIRYSNGWTTQGSLTNSANAYKLLNWGWASGNGRGSLGITNTTQYQAYFYLSSGGSLLTPENVSVAGNITNEWTSSSWYDYIIEYQQTSPTTAVERVWIAQDGQTPVLRTTNYGTTGGSTTWPAINRISLGENFNQVRLADQHLWWGEWSVYDGDKYPNPYNLQ